MRRLANQFDAIAGQKAADFSRCAKTRIAIVNNDSSFLVRFWISPKKFWCTTQNWTCNVAQVKQSLYDQATICFKMGFPQTSFVGFGSCSKTHMIDCCFVSGSMIPHLWWSYKRLLRHRHRIFQHFYAPIDLRLFWAIAGSNENKHFLRPGVHAISNTGGRNAHGMSNDDFALLAHSRHQCFLSQRALLYDLYEIRLWASYGQDWTSFSQCYGIVLYRQTKIQVLQCTLIVIIHVENCEKWSRENVIELFAFFFAKLIF